MCAEDSSELSFVFTPREGGAGLALNSDELELVEQMTKPVPAQVSVSLDGTFRRGAISVENQTIPLNLSGNGTAEVQLFPHSVEVRVLTGAPGPCRFEFTVEINGITRGDKGVALGGKHVHSYSYPFSDFGL